ncbi:MAG: hypothetical protein KME64_37300 [Scytonematopsis contorta HA4267-MV1]|jgi:hypothetical protein|nr:hypothetical protein [Scytonematopsis contorta HA4267-MV1]
MNFRLLFICLVTLFSNFVILKSAVANQDSEICSFAKINSGVLVTVGNPRPTRLVTFSEAGGSPTQINVTCKQPARLTVSPPIQISGPEFIPVSAFTSVTNSNGNSVKSGDAPLLLPVGTTSFLINLSVDKGSRLKAGNYSYTFKFTFVPI